MRLFWDTSAIVPLIFQEPHTASAYQAYSASDQVFAWSWMQVEAEAALLRRQATVSDWQNLKKLFTQFIWLEMAPSELIFLCRFNKTVTLRASDAAHLYVFSKAHSVDPALRLVTFDLEMQTAAEKRKLPFWTARRSIRGSEK